MRIKASQNSDYLLIPSYGELNQFRLKFGQITRQTGNGFTLLSYSLFPTFVIKDKEYKVGGFTFIPTATQSFNNVTETLYSLGLTVAIETGAIVDSTKGLLNVNATFLEYTKLGFKLNQLPQINGIYRLNGGDKMIVIGIDGNYNFNSRLFHGILDVIPYENYLEGVKG